MKERAEGGLYVRVVKDMIRSSVWVGSSKDRKILWMAMLMLADAGGNVFASLPGLAKEAELTIDETRAALAELMAPDEHSRSKDNDGRRLVEIRGGWRIVTYETYRDMHVPSQSDWASRKRRQRASAQQLEIVGTPNCDPGTSRDIEGHFGHSGTSRDILDTEGHSGTSRDTRGHFGHSGTSLDIVGQCVTPNGNGISDSSSLSQSTVREDLTGNRAREESDGSPRSGADQDVSEASDTGTLTDRLSKAYADGIATGSGSPWTLPDPNNDAQVIRSAVLAHKPNLRGEKLLAWVRHSAETYRRVMADSWQYQKGFAPTKWLEWLNAGGDRAPTRRVIGSVAPMRQQGPRNFKPAKEL